MTRPGTSSPPQGKSGRARLCQDVLTEPARPYKAAGGISAFHKECGLFAQISISANRPYRFVPSGGLVVRCAAQKRTRLTGYERVRRAKQEEERLYNRLSTLIFQFSIQLARWLFTHSQSIS